ncbi:MAG: collagen-like protein [Flavobacteriales bacterium]|nr:collagen-like protein [Flavobacteriales bacterium]
MKRLPLILSLVISSLSLLAQQRVGVGTLNPDATAQLELASSSKGVLIPRMSSAQRQMIPNPTNGLLVFDITTVGFWYFDGVQWVQPFGPIGPQGPLGIVGIDGATGPQGPIGQPSTVVGPIGVDGITGAQGLQGSAGPTGVQGTVGSDGIMGVTGNQGPVGATGPQGPQGIVGVQGLIGNTGPQGIAGIAGSIGPQGIAGASGPTGPMGPPSFNTAIAIGTNGLLEVTDPQSTLYSQQAAWLTLGNAVTNPANNFIGTTDVQALNIATSGTERMRALANGEVWVDGSKPFLLRRFNCNGCDDPNRNTGVSTADYVAWVAGFYPTANEDSESTRARMYSSGGTWWFKGDNEGASSEDWSVDVMFVKLEMADDQRPASAQGGGTGF